MKHLKQKEEQIMHQIYNDAKDKNVAITMAYANADKDFLYSDVKRQRMAQRLDEAGK